MEHQGTKRLETERLILRPFVIEDAEAMHRNWAGDPEVTRYLTWPTHDSPAISRWVLTDWASRYADPAYYQWAIIYLPYSETEPIGSIAVVQPIDERVQSAQIGYCIGRSWWRQGVTAEALKRVSDFLFDEVGVRRVEARHDPRNAASGAVMRKCGMRFEGTLRQADWNNQGVCDVSYYGLLAEERGK